MTASVAVSLRTLLEGGLVSARDKWSIPRPPGPGLQAPRWPDPVVHVPPAIGRGGGNSLLPPPFLDRERPRLAPIQGTKVVGDPSPRLQIAQPHIQHLSGTSRHQGGHV